MRPETIWFFCLDEPAHAGGEGVVPGRVPGSSAVVDLAVTHVAQGHKITFSIVTATTACSEVVDVQLSAATAGLTSPAVALQDLRPQLTVRFGLKPKSRALGKVRQAVPRSILVLTQSGEGVELSLPPYALLTRGRKCMLLSEPCFT